MIMEEKTIKSILKTIGIGTTIAGGLMLVFAVGYGMKSYYEIKNLQLDIKLKKKELEE